MEKILKPQDKMKYPKEEGVTSEEDQEVDREVAGVPVVPEEPVGAGVAQIGHTQIAKDPIVGKGH